MTTGAATLASGLSEAVGAPLHVRTIDDLAGIEAIRASWHALRARSEVSSPNNNVDMYVETVRSLPDSSPWIGVVSRAGQVCGLVIGRRTRRSPNLRVGYVRVPLPSLSSIEIVHGGMLHDGRQATVHELTRLLDRERRSGGAELIWVNKVDVSAASFESLSRLPLASVQRAELHWRLHLDPKGFDAILARVGRKRRYNLKRSRRLVDDEFEAVHVEHVLTPEDVERAAPVMSSINGRSYQGALGVGFTDSTNARQRLHALAEAGVLRGYILHFDERPVAFQLGAIDECVFHLQATAFDPVVERFSPGTVLQLEVIRLMTESGVKAIDYGFGDAPYKRMLDAESTNEASIHLYGCNLRGRACATIDRAVSQGESLVRRALGRGGENRLRKSWRAKLRRGRLNR